MQYNNGSSMVQDIQDKNIATIHNPVLLQDCVNLVRPAVQNSQSIIVDCTLGLAGHASSMLKAFPHVHLIGIDRDAQALEKATLRIEQAGYKSRFYPVHAPFNNLSLVLQQLNIEHVQAVFLDLGLSSLQIDEHDRGFSYAQDSPLDMRMDTTQMLQAKHIVQDYSEDALARLFAVYGQEKFARKIARSIVEKRAVTPIVNSSQLVEIADKAIPKAHRRPGNPAKRVFQALRIEVNGELEKLKSVLPQAALHLSVGGRIVVESYHSLEDRIVKQFMLRGISSLAPDNMPVIPEDKKPYFALVTRKAIQADEAEKAQNSRASSVRLRAVELIRPIPLSERKRLEKQVNDYENYGT